VPVGIKRGLNIKAFGGYESPKKWGKSDQMSEKEKILQFLEMV
jgi:hypothetical protein